MTMSFSQKAQSAFKKLGAVALITATLAVFFTACNQTGNTGSGSGSGGGGGNKPTPTPKPKHEVTFSVDGANGTLKAKSEGINETETSPINVEESKEVTFTATANDGYRVKGWTLDGKAVNGTNTEYKLTVTKAAIVKVSFEAIPPTKYTVTLTQTTNGKVTASPEIPADGKVDKDTEITFTAKADDGYRVNTWVISPSSAIKSGGEKGGEAATVKITADTTVNVNFELIPEEKAILTLDANKLNIIIKAKTKDDSDIQVEGCEETTLKSDKAAELHAKGTVVTLKGKIAKLTCINNQLVALNMQGCTSLQELLCHKNNLASLNVQGCSALQMLSCYNNQLDSLDVQGLTALERLKCNNNKLNTLNVQGCTALKYIECQANKLNADMFKKFFIDLPARVAGDDAEAILYTEETSANEGNCKDFTQPADLKTTFDSAKSKNWMLTKKNTSGSKEEIE